MRFLSQLKRQPQTDVKKFRPLKCSKWFRRFDNSAHRLVSMYKTNELALRVVTQISRRHFCNPVCGESKKQVFSRGFTLRYLYTSDVCHYAFHTWLD